MRCGNENIRFANIKDKINILRKLKLSANDIEKINSLIDNIYELKNNEIHLVTKKELDDIFSIDIKNKLIKPISNTPYKRSYVYTAIILANYANTLIDKGLNKQLAILKALYCGSKLLHYPIITLGKKLTMDEFTQKLSDDDFMFCDYLLISKLISKDFEKKKSSELEKLRHEFKKSLQRS